MTDSPRCWCLSNLDPGCIGCCRWTGYYCSYPNNEAPTTCMEVVSDEGLQLYSSRCKRKAYIVDRQVLNKGAPFKW